MAKKTEKASGNKILASLKEFKDNKLKYILAIILGLFSLFLLVSMISYLFTGSADQSMLDINNLNADPNLRVDNQGGKVGVRISNWLINQGFGVASLLFVYLLFITALKLVRTEQAKYWRNTMLSLIAIVWISTLLGLLIPSASGGYHLAGQTGLYIANWLTSMFGYIGAYAIIIIVFSTTLILAFDQFIPWASELKKKLFKSKPKADIDEELDSDEEPDDESIEAYMRDEDIDDDISMKIVDEDEESEDEPEDLDDEEDEVDIFSLELDSEKELNTEEEVEPQTIDITEVSPQAAPAPASVPHRTEIKAEEEELGITVEKTVEEEKVNEHSSVNSLDENYDPTLDLSRYEFPSIDLLDEHQKVKNEVTEEELLENKNKIVETLRHFKIEIVKIRATIGPTITLYEIVPAPGTKVNKIKNLEDDIALSLAALGVRIIAPIPGKGTIGIEVPNKKPEIVSMRSIVASKKFQESKAELPVVMGKTITNETFVFDLAKAPHLLVAGATGQGKSVGLNAIITSLLYKKHPSQLKMVMVDPKMVELNLYSIIEKHFLAKLPDAEQPIITDVDKVKHTLNSLTIEMDERYKLLMKAHARNIKEYNDKFIARRLNPENGHKYLPYIVLVVDEFADLIMTAGKEIEMPIARIAQKARAVGMHMIIATQRPSTNIITGVIKANFPGRIAFRVASMIDSRTILDSPGANQLIGKGDMLFMQGSDMTRLQCAFVDTPEVERVCEHIADQQGYPSAFMLPEYVPEDGGGGVDVDMKQRDEIFEEVARMVVANQMGSTSMIQRKFSIGYNRAGRIMDQLEAAGVVGPSEGSKARQVLVADDYALEDILNNL